MFGLTTLETRLGIACAVMVGILGYTLYERHEGAVQCVNKETKAENSQESLDAHSEATAINTFKQDLADIPPAVSSASHLWVCDAPRVVPSRPAPGRTQSVTPAVVKTDSGLQTGVEPRIDIGAVVQDITLSGMLCSADAQQLWSLAVKESTK